jgi:thiamine-phosphate pyrophosphorylase
MLSTTQDPGAAAADLRQRLARTRLYVVTSAAQTRERTEDVVRAAVAGGADAVQLRRKGDDGLESFRLAERCRRVTAAAGVLLVVNDRLDIAMGVDADGVHLGQDDLPLQVARRLWPGRIVGRSTHSSGQALAAQAEGADYIGVGPVHTTPTKPGRPATGLEFVSAVARTIEIPWVAIGGIDAATVDAVLHAGARAVAVVRAVTDAEDPEQAARALRLRVTRGCRGEP